MKLLWILVPFLATLCNTQPKSCTQKGKDFVVSSIEDTITRKSKDCFFSLTYSIPYLSGKSIDENKSINKILYKEVEDSNFFDFIETKEDSSILSVAEKLDKFKNLCQTSSANNNDCLSAEIEINYETSFLNDRIFSARIYKYKYTPAGYDHSLVNLNIDLSKNRALRISDIITRDTVKFISKINEYVKISVLEDLTNVEGMSIEEKNTCVLNSTFKTLPEQYYITKDKKTKTVDFVFYVFKDWGAELDNKLEIFVSMEELSAFCNGIWY